MPGAFSSSMVKWSQHASRHMRNCYLARGTSGTRPRHMGLLPDTSNRGCACAGNAGTFSPPPHVPWCMPGSLISGFLWIRRKRSRHCRRMRKPQSYVSSKRPMYRSRPKLNYGAGRDFEVGPEFGATRKQPIIPGNLRARSCADEEDRVTWLHLVNSTYFF